MRFVLIILLIQSHNLLARQVAPKVDTISTSDYQLSEGVDSYMDYSFGLAGNSFLGNVHNYLKVGGGFTCGIMKVKNDFGIGLIVNGYFNPFRKPFPVNSTREQKEAPSTILVGLALNKKISQKENKEFSVQLEFNYLHQYITHPLSDTDNGNIEFSGFSPGLILNYAISSKKKKYGDTEEFGPTVKKNCVNFHLAIRPLLFKNNPSAAGTMIEVGIAYHVRMYSQ